MKQPRQTARTHGPVTPEASVRVGWLLPTDNEKRERPVSAPVPGAGAAVRRNVWRLILSGAAAGAGACSASLCESEQALRAFGWRCRFASPSGTTAHAMPTSSCTELRIAGSMQQQSGARAETARCRAERAPPPRPRWLLLADREAAARPEKRAAPESPQSRRRAEVGVLLVRREAAVSRRCSSRPMGKRGPAGQRSCVRSRRLCGKHNSAIAGSPCHPVDTATATVGGCRTNHSGSWCIN
jgi:hypothetical protein